MGGLALLCDVMAPGEDLGFLRWSSPVFRSQFPSHEQHVGVDFTGSSFFFYFLPAQHMIFGNFFPAKL